LLRGAVWGGSRSTVAATAAVGLAIALLGDAVGLLGSAAVAAHLLATIPATTVAATSATTTAATGTGVRGLVNADGASVEPGAVRVALGCGNLGRRCTHSMLFMAWMAFWASSSLL
jgi:hypothetical protein